MSVEEEEVTSKPLPANGHPQGLLRSACSFPVVLGALLMVLAVFTVKSRFSEPDMWWHLKTGELIWNTNSIPTADPFSFTAAGRPWVPQEWLSDLTIYGAYQFGGYSGLVLWGCLVGSLVLIAGYAICWMYSGNYKVAFAGAFGIWFFGTIGLVIRPHLIGYLMLLLELLILHLGRTRNARWFLALPPLFALWINFHSSFVFGIIVLGAVLGCSFPNFRAGLLTSVRRDKRERTALAVSLALSVAALFLNPIGPRLVWYPLDVMLKQPLNIASVSEWQPAPFNDVRAWALLALAGSVLLIPVVRRASLSLQEFVLVALGFGMAAQHERMLFVFGILAMPIVCRLLADGWRQPASSREHVVLNAFLIVTAGYAVISGFPDSRDLARQIDAVTPARAVEFIKRAGLHGPMLNEYVYGGYLIWAAPEYKVFIDGRADVYEPAGVLAEYGKWATVEEDPRLLLDKYQIRLCLMSRRHPISRVMPLLANWRLVYSDHVSVVFARQD